VPITIPVANSLRDTVPITVVMTRAGVPLPTVVTKAKGDSAVRYLSPGLQAFEERRHKGFGHFISEAELRKRDHSPLSDALLGHMPGLADRRGEIYTGRQQGAPCYVTVYLDGALMYSMANVGQPRPNFQRMPTQEYAGVEFYQGGASIPQQY